MGNPADRIVKATILNVRWNCAVWATFDTGEPELVATFPPDLLPMKPRDFVGKTRAQAAQVFDRKATRHIGRDMQPHPKCDPPGWSDW